jgi:CubicO group peptidase (beta-lactamase class C family)
MSLLKQDAGLDSRALERLRDAIEADVEAERYDGAVVMVARRGEIGLHEAIGFANRDAGRAARPDDVFRVLSLTKAFTNALVLAAIDAGKLALTTPVVEVIPEFTGSDRFRGMHKNRVTIAHLLTHRAALVPTPTPLPYEQLGSLQKVVAAICELDLVGVPGTEVNYSPALAHALLGEIVWRLADGDISFAELARRDLFEPLGMTSTAFGVPDELAERIVPLVARNFPPGGWLGPADIEVMNSVISTGAELPWVGSVSTAEDVLRFAEMLRRGGELDGVRILSRPMLEQATRIWTGDAPNDLYKGLFLAMGWEVAPANIGLGFGLRGGGLHHTFFGTQASPGTYGNYGAGSTLFWVDPARDMTFVCLTAGVMEESANVERFQRLSDLATAAAL